MFKLVKNESRKISQAFFHPSFIYLTIVGNLLLIIATVAVYFLEKDSNPKMHSFFDSLWWGVSTITTVGYGDISPVTTGGRIVGIILMYTGTVLFVAFTSLLLSFLLKEEVDKEIQPLEDEVLKEEQTQRRILELLEELNRKIK